MANSIEEYPDETADTTLCNLNHVDDEFIDTYIGGETDAYEDLSESPFRNPYDTSEYGHFEAVEHFKVYFYHRYLEEQEFRKAAHSMEHERLGCWCYPNPCHGTVIVDLLNAHIDEGDEGVYSHIEEEISKIDNSRLGKEGFAHLEQTKDILESIDRED